MKSKRLLTLVLLLAFPHWPAAAQGLKAAKNITFDKAAFDQSLVGAVGPSVMGYQYVLVKDGKVVTEKAGGTARTAQDGGPMKMTVNTPLNIGSLQKFITGTAMINIMEKPWVYSPDKDKPLQTRLDRKMSTLFPYVWSKNMMKGVGNISFRQLLQHRSGFDDAYKGDRNVMGFIKEGFNPAQFDKREYSNINFTMVGYLLPLYHEPGLANSFDQSISSNKLADDAADAYVRDVLGKKMHQMFVDRIFSKMTPSIKPSCDATNELKATAGYGYQTKSSTKGVIASMIEKKGHCSGEGGYFMSARDFANYVAHFSVTDLIVTKTGHDAMFTEGMTPDDRLVWTAASGDNWMKEKFQMPVVVWSNGIPANGKTVLIRLPQNHYLVLFTNSDELGVNQLYNAGVAAFKAGMQHNFN